MIADDIWTDARRTPIFEGVDATRFREDIQPRRQPAILKGLVRDWKVTEAARQSREILRDYLISVSSEAPFDAFYGAAELNGGLGFNDDFSGFNFEKRPTQLAPFLDALIQHADDTDPAALYSSALNLMAHFPKLIGEAPLDLIPAQYERLVSLWIGNQVRTAAHWDLPQNVGCVLSGRRRYTLMPLTQAKNLYIGPLDFTVAGRPTSLVDFRNPDFERFPRFREAMAVAEIADLEPGDAIYIPSVWIHHVETLDPFGLMMNFWWRDAPEHMLSPYLTMLHSILTLKDLPAHEREAWRALFDLYVFQTDGPAMEHLPARARGVWGALTPESIRDLKRYLARTLGA